MITNAEQRYLDRAKQISYEQYLLAHSVTEKMCRTMWFLLCRGVYFARKQCAVEHGHNVALAAIAKQSRKSVRQGTQDGGTQGYMRELIEKGIDVCFDPKSLRVAEKHLEAMGIWKVERRGHGLVPLFHINLRSASLFLEAYHPDFERLESLCGGVFYWLKGFCDEVLGRPFNRKDGESDIYNMADHDRDSEVYQLSYPSRKFGLDWLSGLARDAINRFCKRTRKVLDSICVFWDVDISNPPVMEF
jgi:hypothetical protein